MSYYDRILHLGLTQGQSAFLWGARNTGKSTFLKQKYPNSIYYDLLDTDLFNDLNRQPSILREQLSAIALTDKIKLTHPIIIDEVQKIPRLLDEVHWLIENRKLSFILCGSSARKLKRGSGNLLGGRAWKFTFFPLTKNEVFDFDLLKALNHGLIPSIYQSSNINRSFHAYVHLYLKEEIQMEGLVRNLPAFSRFLDLLGFANGEMLNYRKIATDCGVDAKTIKEYFQILIDTLIGYYLMPFNKQVKRQIISSTPKFYLFDVGIGNYLAKRTVLDLRGMTAGFAFEHFILMELIAYINIKEINSTIHYWRSKTGLEVDFVLDNGRIAIEVKITSNPTTRDQKGLIAFQNDYQPDKAILVCLAKQQRVTANDIHIMPWEAFLNDLWNGQLL